MLFPNRPVWQQWTLWRLIALTAPICLLASGAYQLAQAGASHHVLFALLVTAIVLRCIGWFPTLSFIWVDLVPLAAIVVPAAVHLAFLERGESSKFFGCDIADIVLGALVLMSDGYALNPRPLAVL